MRIDLEGIDLVRIDFVEAPRSEFDPHPESLRTASRNATDQLLCSLLALNKLCAFLHISTHFGP